MTEKSLENLATRAQELLTALSAQREYPINKNPFVKWLEALRKLELPGPELAPEDFSDWVDKNEKALKRECAKMFARRRAGVLVHKMAPQPRRSARTEALPVDILIAVSNFLRAAQQAELRVGGALKGALPLEARVIEPLITEMFQHLLAYLTREELPDLSVASIRWMSENRPPAEWVQRWGIDLNYILVAEALEQLDSLPSPHPVDRIPLAYRRLRVREDAVSVAVDAAFYAPDSQRPSYITAATGALCIAIQAAAAPVMDEVREVAGQFGSLFLRRDAFAGLGPALNRRRDQPREGQFPGQRELAHEILDELDKTSDRDWKFDDDRETIAAAVATAGGAHVDVVTRVLVDYLGRDESIFNIRGVGLALSTLAVQLADSPTTLRARLQPLAKKLERGFESRGYADSVANQDRSQRARGMELDVPAQPLSEGVRIACIRRVLRYISESPELARAGAQEHFDALVRSMRSDRRFTEATRGFRDDEGPEHPPGRLPWKPLQPGGGSPQSGARRVPAAGPHMVRGTRRHPVDRGEGPRRPSRRPGHGRPPTHSVALQPGAKRDGGERPAAPDNKVHGEVRPALETSDAARGTAARWKQLVAAAEEARLSAIRPGGRNLAGARRETGGTHVVETAKAPAAPAAPAAQPKVVAGGHQGRTVVISDGIATKVPPAITNAAPVALQAPTPVALQAPTPVALTPAHSTAKQPSRSAASPAAHETAAESTLQLPGITR